MKNAKIESFQTFYVSKEESACPLIPNIFNLAKTLNKLKIEGDSNFTISIKFGKRIIINSEKSNFKNLEISDILEVVDYNPIKKTALIIGKKSPSENLPIHWIVQNAKDHVNFVLQIDNKDLSIKNIPETNIQGKTISIDLIKDILRTLKEKNEIIVKNKGLIIVGQSLKDIEKSIKSFWGS